MIRKISIIAAVVCVGSALCVSTTSCKQKRDKYYYMHELVDLQKSYDEAKEDGDEQKMTEVSKRMQTTQENIKNCVLIEQDKKKDSPSKDKKEK